MLKWAVHAPRQSYLPAFQENSEANHLQLNTRASLITSQLNNNNDITILPNTPSSTRRRKVKRKSSDCYLSRRLHHWLEKENQITSTPLCSATQQRVGDCPLRQLDSLRDLSNIVIESSAHGNGSLKQSSSTKTSLPLTYTNGAYNNPSNYAATLPSLEVEYSPSGLVPGPVLALRGLGVVDSYFEKPRYFPPAELTNQSAIDIKDNRDVNKPISSLREETTTLSSSKMGDQTLERMIDAILESTRKEKKPTKVMKQAHNYRNAMSPTYTPAEDPANDLHEFWPKEHSVRHHRHHIKKRRRSLPATRKPSFSEREVCSPCGSHVRPLKTNSSLLHLRRQRVVRRKRKSCKLIAPKTLEIENVKETFKQQEQQHVVDSSSADSGHNSFSELEENYSVLENNCRTMLDGALQANNLRELDATKRRLSFSNRNSNAQQPQI